jgi:hypothetical protein
MPIRLSQSAALGGVIQQPARRQIMGGLDSILNGFLGNLFDVLSSFLNSMFGWLSSFFGGLNVF